MPDDANRPGLVRRIAPWLLAIIVGIGVGWLVGGQFAPDQPAAGVAAADTRAAPPPVPPKQLPPTSPPARELGPPITLAISNRDCNWGADFERYARQAQTILLHAGRHGAGRDAATVRVRVPDLPWNGLTVTAIEAFYDGTGIIFAEPLAQVRAALTQAGMQVTAEGRIPLDYDMHTVQAVRATNGSAVRYGATVLTCAA